MAKPLKESADRAMRRALELLGDAQMKFGAETVAKEAFADLSLEEVRECWELGLAWFLVLTEEAQAKGTTRDPRLSKEEWQKGLEESCKRFEELVALVRLGESP